MTDEQFKMLMSRLDGRDERIDLIERILDAQSTPLVSILAAQQEGREHNSLIERFFRHLQIDFKAAVAADAAETRIVAREAGRVIECIYAEWKETGTINGQVTDLIAQLQGLVGLVTMGQPVGANDG